MESGGGAAETTRSCPHCGAALGAYASFCWECQQSVNAPTGAAAARPPVAPPPVPHPPTVVHHAPPAPAPTRPGRRRGLRLGPTLAALAVVAIASVLGLWIGSGGAGNDGGGAGDEPRQGAEHLGRWLTQVATFDGDLSESRVEQGVQSFAALGLEVDVLRSDDFASLPPGSWIFYERASSTADEAVARCIEIGRTDRNQCLARLLSDDEGDRDEVRFVQ